MTITKAELHPDTPFSLGAAAAFDFGPRTAAPGPDAGEMRLAFVADDLCHHAGVHLVQRPDGTITAAVDSEADPEAVLGQARRILSLDHPAAGWLAAGERDPVLGGLQRRAGRPRRSTRLGAARAMEPEEALRDLRRLPGIAPAQSP